MSEESAENVHFLPVAGKSGGPPVPRRPDAAQQALAKLGITAEDLVGNLAELATRGEKRVTVRDGKGKVLTETITEDPSIRLKATKALIELVQGKPKKIKRGYAEEIEW